MYLAEHLPRLGQISIKLDFPETAKSISGIGIRQSNLVIQASSTYTTPLPIHDASVLEKAKIEGANFGTEVAAVNLAVGTSGDISDASFMSLSKSDNQRWSVKDLVRKTPQNKDNVNEFCFCCAGCGAEIINSKQKKFLDMPSEFWYEMMDFWHCHKPHEHHHNENDKNFNGKLVPAAGNVHIGSSYLLTADGPSKCPNCGCTLGVDENQAVRIYKWKLELKYGGVTETYPPYAFVFYSLLDKVNSSAVRKVSIKSGKSTYNIWVSNLGLNVSVTETPLLTNALKLLYIELPSRLEEEVLEVPDEVFESFKQHITHINARLPETCRTLQMSENDALATHSISYLSAD